MVETESEVEKVLREIRERVRSENGASKLLSAANAAADDKIATGETHSNDELRAARAALLRVEMNLATSERASNRLPPILSYRHGLLARLELWLKRQIKRATHWYVWEQINFNYAAQQSLSELLNSQRQMLAVVQEQMLELQMLAQQLFALRTELQILRVASEERAAGIDGRIAALETALNSESAEIAELRQTTMAHLERLRAEAHQVVNELRERVAHIGEEQRVALKQLALQTSETAVFNDRTWRSFERRIAALEERSQVDT